MPKNHKPMLAPEVTFTFAEKSTKLLLSLDKYSTATIHNCLQRAIYLEEYEEAALYRDELKRRVACPD